MSDEERAARLIEAIMLVTPGHFSSAWRALTWEPWELLSLILSGGRRFERALVASEALWKAVAREPA